MVELYLQYRIHLHDVVFNYLITGTTLNLFATRNIFKIQNLSINNLHSSPSIIRMIKSRRIRWVGHVA
jgi:hypothetical protein